MVADIAVAPSRRERLREVTNVVHCAIDAKVSQAEFLTTRRGYNAYVSATLQARGRIERTLCASGVADHYPHWPTRALTATLQEDAADLGLEESPPDAAAPSLGPGGVWGALYVLEGSALGARVLQLRVEAIGMCAAFGARHLHHQTADTNAWKDFLRQLNSVSFSPADESDCLRTALATFRAFALAYGAGVTL